MINEADTCRKYVLPKLIASGWDDDPRSFTEQKTFTDGRIVLIGEKVRRRPQKRADYLLRYTRDFVIAVVEAKAAYKSPSDGLQQACRARSRRLINQGESVLVTIAPWLNGDMLSMCAGRCRGD